MLDDPQLPRLARKAIADGANQVEIKPATPWEIAIKISLGKYELPEPYSPFMERELKENPGTAKPTRRLLPAQMKEGDTGNSGSPPGSTCILKDIERKRGSTVISDSVTL